MTATPITDLARRVLANVDAGRPDHAPGIMEVPIRTYLDPDRFRAEIDAVFHRSPLLVALSCDVPEPGDFTTVDIAERPIVVMRSEDGVVRTFLNACRHRGASVADECFGHARRLTCPYHFWVYDTAGKLVGVTGPEGFEGMDVDGLIEYPTAERAGAIFAVLTTGATFDVDEWLGDMAGGLEMLQLDKLHRYDVETRLPSGNWKATADGYVDGYHLGYLHRNSIGARSITNRNTYDAWGPHVRIGFANKPILEMRDQPVEAWDLYEAISLVHFVFPNVSLSGQPGRSIMFSRILPGPTVGECTVSQYQYFREPLLDDAAIAEAEAKRARYESVTYEEDFLTVTGIGRRMPAMADDVVRFGRNEIGNQTIHSWVQRIVDAGGLAS